MLIDSAEIGSNSKHILDCTESINRIGTETTQNSLSFRAAIEKLDSRDRAGFLFLAGDGEPCREEPRGKYGGGNAQTNGMG